MINWGQAVYHAAKKNQTKISNKTLSSTQHLSKCSILLVQGYLDFLLLYSSLLLHHLLLLRFLLLHFLPLLFSPRLPFLLYHIPHILSIYLVTAFIITISPLS